MPWLKREAMAHRKPFPVGRNFLGEKQNALGISPCLRFDLFGDAGVYTSSIKQDYLDHL